MTPKKPSLAKVSSKAKRKGASMASGFGFSGPADSYEGAKTYGKSMVWINPNPADSEDQLNPWTRRVLSGLGSHLYRNVGFVRGAINSIARHSVGAGMFPFSSVEDLEIAKAHDDYFRQWSKICEVTGRFSFDKVLEITSKAIDAEGDIGWILGANSEDYPSIQVVRSHRISAEDDDYRDGVKRNALGRHVSYSVCLKGLNGDEKFIRTPASSFILIGDPDRADDLRYGSGLAHGILHMRDKKDILGFEKLGVKVASSLALKLKRKDDPTSSFFGTKTKEGTRDFEAMGGGQILNINPDEDAEIFSSNRPSPTFTGFLEYIDRDVAIGLGLPLEFVWDPSKLGGTAQRFVLQLAQHRFEERQRLLAWHATRVRNWVIAKAIKNGSLEFHPDWWRVEWQFCSKITVDVGREADANRNDYLAGLRTAKEDYAERGRSLLAARRDNFESARGLLKQAEELVSEFASSGINITQALELLEKRGNSGSPPANANQPTAKPAQDKATA